MYTSAELELLYLLEDYEPPKVEAPSRAINFLDALKLANISEYTSDEYFRDKIMVAYMDCNETAPLEWELTSTKGYKKWEELRHDKETNFGKAPPRDMLYAFILLPWSPAFRKGSDLSKHFHHLWNKQYPGADLVMPSLSSLKFLLGSDTLVNGMWIVIVRMPRPVHGKPHIPLSMRKEYSTKFVHESDAEWQARRLEIKRKAEAEVHPTEAQLYLTPNQTLLQEVGKNIVCSKCGAKGHHHEKSHDDVYAESGNLQEFLDITQHEQGSEFFTRDYAAWNYYRSHLTVSYVPKYPVWMKVKPYPKESIVLTKLLDEDKGLTLQIRQAETKIPLRLARKLMMDGLQIDGEVYASGVGTRKRVRREAEEEAEKLKHFTSTDADPFAPLEIRIQDEEQMDLEFRQNIWEYYNSYSLRARFPGEDSPSSFTFSSSSSTS